MKGYLGKILWVDCGTGQTSEEIIPDEVYEKVIGGVGLAAWVLYQRIPAGADPLGPDNILAFTSGPLSGTGALFSGRWMVCGKSPLTGTWGDSNCGGTLAPAIKQAGYDGIFFTGISPKPVYLYADNDTIELRDASHLWGKDTNETEDTLASELKLKRKPAIACIGAAGEKISLISGIVNDHGRIAARSGMGAVMGSKRLKAVVLAGSKPIACVDRKKIVSLNQQFAPSTKIKLKLPTADLLTHVGKLMRVLPVQMKMDGLMSVPIFRQYGTSSWNQIAAEIGDAPVKNWAGSSKDYHPAISKGVSPDLFEKNEKKKYHCNACPLGCGGIFASNGRYEETHKPEYETTNSFGAMLMINDLEAITEINDMLNRAGMDSISAGSVVAFAMECFQHGNINSEDTNGIPLEWGNADSAREVVRMMINREGIGNLLADGVQRAAASIGNGSHQAAIHAGGQEMAYHDPRYDPGYGLHSSVDPTPGKHTTGSQMYYEMYRIWKKVKDAPAVPLFYSKTSKYLPDREKAKAAVANSCFTWLYSSAGLCMFGANIGADRMPVFDWLNAAAGWEKTPEEYMEIGRRIQTLRQMFNIKHGIDPNQIKAHPRTIGAPVQKEGANKGRSFDLETMIRDYWREIGWDEQTGIPTSKTLEHLGLEELQTGKGY